MANLPRRDASKTALRDDERIDHDLFRMIIEVMKKVEAADEERVKVRDGWIKARHVVEDDDD